MLWWHYLIDNITNVITSTASMIAAGATVYGVFKIRKLERNTNGMHHELIEEVRKSSRANGVAQGRAETQ